MLAEVSHRIRCVCLNNGLSQIRSTFINCSFLFNANECNRSCNTINYLCPRIYVPDKAKNMNTKALNLMSKVNETRFLIQHESCKFKCRSNKNISSDSLQKCSHYKFQCDCNWSITVLVKKVTCGILVHVIVSVMKHVNLVSISILKIMRATILLYII